MPEPRPTPTFVPPSPPLSRIYSLPGIGRPDPHFDDDEVDFWEAPLPTPPPPEPRFPLAWDANELATLDPAAILTMDWLLPGWAEWGDVAIWAGDPGVGKSLVCLAAQVAICLGEEILGYWPALSQPHNTSLLDLENRKTVLQRRVIRICDGFGADYRKLVGQRLFPFWLRGREIFTEEKVRQQLLATLIKTRSRLLVLDTMMAANNQPDLSPQNGIRFVRDNTFALAREFVRAGLPEPAWWLITHMRKSAPGEGDKRIGNQDAVSGGGFVGATDATFLLQADGDSVLLTNGKQRHSKKPEQLQMILDDGGDPLAPLRIIFKSASAAGGDSALNLAFLQQYLRDHELAPGAGCPRPELVSVLAERLNTSPQTARRQLASWVDLGLFLPTGELRARPQGGKADPLFTLPK